MIKHTVSLLSLVEELGNVSCRCKTMGLSRDNFYRHEAAVELGGDEKLFDKSRRPPNLKNCVEEMIEQSMLDSRWLIVRSPLGIDLSIVANISLIRPL